MKGEIEYNVGDKVVLKECSRYYDNGNSITIDKFKRRIKFPTVFGAIYSDGDYFTFRYTMIDHEVTAKLNNGYSVPNIEYNGNFITNESQCYGTNWQDYINENISEDKMKKFDKVIFNEPATIVIWKDKTKTVVKAMEEDGFDPERGFLQAYFEATSGMSKTQCNKMLQSLREQYEKQMKQKLIDEFAE